jgi:hypothetical protein
LENQNDQGVSASSNQETFGRIATQVARTERPPVVGYSVLNATKQTETTNARGRVGVVLLKFYFNGPRSPVLAPLNIPVVERESQATMEAENQEKVVKLGLPIEDAAPGRYREGKVDTGINTIKVRGSVCVNFDGFAAGLLDAGLHLARVEQWDQPGKKQGKDVTTTVLCFGFERSPNPSAPDVSRIAKLVSSMPFENVAVWDNPDRTTTVNFTNLKGIKDKPVQAVTVKNKQILMAAVVKA